MDVEERVQLSRFVDKYLALDEELTHRAMAWPAASIPDGLPPIDETMRQLPVDLRRYYTSVDAERRAVELAALRQLASLAGRMQADGIYGDTAIHVLRLLACRYRQAPDFIMEWTPEGL